MPPPNYAELGIDVKALYDKAILIIRSRLKRTPNLVVQEEDLAQDVLLDFHAGWSASLCPPENFIYMQVIHHIDRHLRKASTRALSFTDPANVIEFPDSRISPELDLIYRDQEQLLYTFIEKKNSECRILAEWALRFDQKTSREIATLMGVSSSHIDYLKRILKRIMRDFLSSAQNTDSPANRLLKKLDGEMK